MNSSIDIKSERARNSWEKFMGEIFILVRIGIFSSIRSVKISPTILMSVRIRNLHLITWNRI